MLLLLLLLLLVCRLLILFCDMWRATLDQVRLKLQWISSCIRTHARYTVSRKKSSPLLLLWLLGQMLTILITFSTIILQRRTFAINLILSSLCTNITEQRNKRYSVCFQCCRFVLPSCQFLAAFKKVCSVPNVPTQPSFGNSLIKFLFAP